MPTFQRRFSLVIALLTFPCALWATTGGSAGSAVQAGLVVDSPKDDVFLYFAEPLRPKQTVFLQKANAKGKASCCTKISSRQLVPDGSESQRIEQLIGDKFYSYKLVRKPPVRKPGIDEDDEAMPPTFTGVALAAPNASMADRNGLRAQRKGKTFARTHLCFGIEGVNLISRINGENKHMYLPFGFEIEATPPECTAADLRVMTGQ